jgi:hypothetical protein
VVIVRREMSAQRPSPTIPSRNLTLRQADQARADFAGDPYDVTPTGLV